MSTWHQDRNPQGLQALWQPHATDWKCVSDKPGQLASAMCFAREDEARSYCERWGCVLIPPQSANAQKGTST
jgi:hypothetical protein